MTKQRTFSSHEDPNGNGDDGPPNDSDEVPSPMVVAQVEHALAPYRPLLPAEVLAGFGKSLIIVLESHPNVIGIVHRLRQSTASGAEASKEGDTLFDGDAMLWHHLQISLMKRLRVYTLKNGLVSFVPPEASEGALYVCTMSFEAATDAQTEAEEILRMRLETLCTSMVGAMFLGLACHLEWVPESLADWGDTGNVLSVVQPRIQATLRRATAALSRPDAALLDLYQLHFGDVEEVADTMGLHVDEAVACLARTFERLSSELPAAVEATALDPQGLH